MTVDYMEAQKYQAQIRRDNPTCILFIIDQSGSMNDAAMGTQRAKKQAVASVLNRFLYNMTIRCAQGEGNEVYPYFHVGVVGYSNDSAQSIFTGALQGRNLVTISELASHARLQQTQEGGRLVTQRVWFDAFATGGTPMCAALKLGGDIVSDFIVNHNECYPPMVVHITDGESTDGDPTQEALRISNLESRDGKVLFFNLHISSISSTGIIFPSSDAGLPDSFARMLFGMSSVLPQRIIEDAGKQGYGINHGARAFSFNTDMSQLTSILDVGSRRAMAQMQR